MGVEYFVRDLQWWPYCDINQSLGRVSLVKMDHLVHQDSLRQCTMWDLK